uniref:Putative secreted peptide n=1 Tax=Anopheles braziliensis TaxID=58242 RepID=A0A2M3ZQZ1_9DIPT
MLYLHLKALGLATKLFVCALQTAHVVTGRIQFIFRSRQLVLEFLYTRSQPFHLGFVLLGSAHRMPQFGVGLREHLLHFAMRMT